MDTAPSLTRADVIRALVDYEMHDTLAPYEFTTDHFRKETGLASSTCYKLLAQMVEQGKLKRELRVIKLEGDNQARRRVVYWRPEDKNGNA